MELIILVKAGNCIRIIEGKKYRRVFVRNRIWVRDADSGFIYGDKFMFHLSSDLVSRNSSIFLEEFTL